ncbi:MAG: sulfurtransferase [Rhodospirillales bacterium]|nr:sulfurtransferase [Rhodospirillales bacterium]
MTRLSAPLLAGAAALLLTAGTAQAAPPPAAGPLVSPAWLAAHAGAAHLVVLDIRPAAAYAAGHVPGAVGADYEHSGWRVRLPDGAGGALPPIPAISAVIGEHGVGDGDRAVIVASDFAAAARIYWTFKVLGHRNVSILDGGWQAWQAAHDPVSTAAVVPAHAVFTARYQPALRAQLPEVAADIRTGAATLVDARPPAQWNGTAKTRDVAEYGHLPHAVWVDQSRALEDGRLKPKAELEKIFAKVPNKPATTYCNTGHLAATDWFVLAEVLHHKNVKLYDGSMSEWTADANRPIVR